MVEAFAAPVRLVAVPTESATDESELVRRSGEGEREAFEELVRRYADRLHAGVVRFVGDSEEAREVTQETFLRAWRGIAAFRGDSRFFTWLYRIAINEAKRRGERRGRWKEAFSFDEEAAPEAPDWSEAPETRFEQADLRRVLDEAIGELPLDYRIALVLRDVEGLSTAEAASAMCLGEAALKSRLHRARLAVRSSLESYFEEDHNSGAKR